MDSYRSKKVIRGPRAWILLFGLLASQAALALTPATTPIPAQLSMRHDGHNYKPGIYFFVPLPLDNVKAMLEKGIDGAGLKGFRWKDRSAALSKMESYWVTISLANQPALQEELNQEVSQKASSVLDKALAAGTITPDEKTQFQQAIQQQREYNYDDLKDVPFFVQRINRWTFTRKTGRSKVVDDFGVIMDVSSPLNRDPMTLVWFGGMETVTTKRLRLVSCLVGVTCFPDPHIERESQVNDKVSPAFERAMSKLAADLHAMPLTEAANIMRTPDRNAPLDQVPKVASSIAPVQEAPTFDLPDDEANFRRYDNDRWRLLALPDGSALISGWPQTHRLVLKASRLERQSTAPHFPGAAGLKLDPNGTLWGMSHGDTIFAPVLLSWRLDKTKAVAHPLPGLEDRPIEDWVVQPGRGAAIRASDTLYSLSEKNGVLTHHLWNSSLRREAIDTQKHVAPRVSSRRVHFNDGLFWLADRDGYGISPDTGRVTKTVKTSTENLIFGSLEANWGMAPVTISGERYYRIVDLKSGLPRWDLNTPTVHYPSGLARTAHGRLLATSSDASNTPIAVLDMRSGTPIANIRVPEGFRVVTIAFSWKGDALWVYLMALGTDNTKVMVWNVPEPLHDPASDTAIPDQVRCTVSTCE